MRVDYYHSGNAAEDRIALERVVRDGVWAGGRTRLTDTLDLGLYCLRCVISNHSSCVRARVSQRVWRVQTKQLPPTALGTYHESLRFPWPRQPVDVVSSDRHEGAWRELWTRQSIHSRSSSTQIPRPPAATSGLSSRTADYGESGLVVPEMRIYVRGDGEIPRGHAADG